MVTEMAWSLYLAGFDVKDVHMTDLITGRETLEDINLIVLLLADFQIQMFLVQQLVGPALLSTMKGRKQPWIISTKKRHPEFRRL